MEKKTAIQAVKRAWSIKTAISNVVWFFVGGIWLGIIFASLGVALCLTVVGFRAGRVCYRHAWVAMFPYGKKVEIQSGRHPAANVIWAIFVGWWFSFLCIMTGVLCMVTVIGFFRGLQAFKLMKLAIFPFGADLIDAK